VLRLTKEKVTFLPDGPEAPSLSWPLGSITDCVFQRKDIAEFHVDGREYRFAFASKSPMKWVYYLRYLKGYAAVEERGYY
jgi:hypothetical protein